MGEKKTLKEIAVKSTPFIAEGLGIPFGEDEGAITLNKGFRPKDLLKLESYSDYNKSTLKSLYTFRSNDEICELFLQTSEEGEQGLVWTYETRDNKRAPYEVVPLHYLDVNKECLLTLKVSNESIILHAKLIATRTDENVMEGRKVTKMDFFIIKLYSTNDVNALQLSGRGLIAEGEIISLDGSDVLEDAICFYDNDSEENKLVAQGALETLKKAQSYYMEKLSQDLRNELLEKHIRTSSSLPYRSFLTNLKKGQHFMLVSPNFSDVQECHVFKTLSIESTQTTGKDELFRLQAENWLTIQEKGMSSTMVKAIFKNPNLLVIALPLEMSKDDIQFKLVGKMSENIRARMEQSFHKALIQEFSNMVHQQ